MWGCTRVVFPQVTFKREFRALPHTYRHATTQTAEQFPERNRFPHILPYDHSRVKLQADSSSRCSYINASYMSGFRSVVVVVVAVIVIVVVVVVIVVIAARV